MGTHRHGKRRAVLDSLAASRRAGRHRCSHHHWSAQSASPSGQVS